MFLATRHHLYTVASLQDGSFGVAVPPVRALAYEDALLAEDFDRATYVFADIERLSTWERMVAAEFFRALQAAGCRCLNDPARVMTRYGLLRTLHHAGLNPFRIWRLDDALLAGLTAPAPKSWLRGWQRRRLAPRYPVFLRTDADHDTPLTGPLETPEALAQAIERLDRDGVPVGGMLLIEFFAEPIAEGVWAKFGTMRIGDMVSTDHAVVEANWCVRSGTPDLATPEMFAWEHDLVAANGTAAALTSAFAAGRIEYGRADHATVRGREVVFEINTNPNLLPLAPQKLAIRDETLRIARTRFADGLRAIDTGEGGRFRLERGPRRALHAGRSAGSAAAFRP